MNINIENVRPNDVVETSKVFKDCWLDTYPNTEYGITREDIEHFYRNSLTKEALDKKREQIINLPKNEKYLVAKDDEKVIGVCRLIKHPDNNELKSIYIMSSYRGKGIGTMFWNEALKFFDPKKDIVVTVAIYNKNAIDFYSKLGFVDTGRRFSDEKFRMKSGSIIPDLEMIKRE
jgi:ribosomal protein S18 acetylase RimI-like enzyme